MAEPKLLHQGEIVDDPRADIKQQQIDVLDRKIREKKAELEDINAAGKAIASRLYNAYLALQAFFEIHDAPVGASAPANPTNSSTGPLDISRYAPWKNKYPGQTAQAIDILVKYEAGLSRKQLAGFLGIASGSGSMSQIIFKLNKADLIIKDGDLIRLKRL